MEHQISTRPKIGVVLSGGGARGAAHIGVLKILEEMQIPIDYLAGTSMGSIAAGLYASGMSVEEIEKVLISIDWDDVLQDNIPRENRSFRRKTDDRRHLVKSKPGLGDDLEIKLPSGLLHGQKIDLLFKELVMPVIHIKSFDDLAIPYRAVATDIVTGDAVILDSGDLATAMRASMTVPAIFSPVEINGKLLVDGGVSNNLPIDVVRKMGADIVIAVDISTPLRSREELVSTLDITSQLSKILTRKNTEAQIATLTDKDVLIVPDLGDITTGSFDRVSEAIPPGVAAAQKSRDKLSGLSLPIAEYRKYVAVQQSTFEEKAPPDMVIDFIKLNNQSNISDDMVYEHLQIKEGAPLDLEKLEKNIGTLYGMELFENISYDIAQEENKTGLIINIKEKSWGPNYIQGGITMGGNQDGDNFYDLSLSYTRTAINRLNGEWRTNIQVGNSPGFYTELYQPLSLKYNFFIHPQLLYNKTTVSIYDDNDRERSQYRLTQYGGDLAFGKDFGTWGESRIGIRRLTGDAELKIGTLLWPSYDFDRGEIYAKISADTLDNVDFPKKGYSGFMEYLRSDETLGADHDFDQIRLAGNWAMSWKDHTITATGKLFSTLDDQAPLQNQFKLGGLFNLSGYNKDQLLGSQLGLLSLIYMYRLNDFKILPIYLGGSLETGNVWREKSQIDLGDAIIAGSIFLGIDTFLGPVYIGYGKAEGNHQSLYFYLGKGL